MAHDPAGQLLLPESVATPVDVGRLIREFEQIDNAALQLSIRGDKSAELPKVSLLMDRLIQLNHLNLLDKSDRATLQTFLLSIKKSAPVIHMSFSADPTVVFVDKLMAWLRREIHPLVLLTVGLQPGIGAGCVVRTTNKQFDFSLRQDFSKKRDILKAALSAPAVTQPDAAPAPAATPAEVAA